MPAPSFPPANKRLGQNFLIDPNIVRKIVALAELTPDTSVLEIGPGRGILTEALSHAAGQVVAIEVDPMLYRLLQERGAEWPNVELVCGDALQYPMDRLPDDTTVVANLPYYISTPLLFRLLEYRQKFPHMVLMLQEEVADRLVAKPGTEEYGVLSVMVQYAADINKAFRVSANCFRPRPEVGSAVVSLRTKPHPSLSAGEEAAFAKLVKSAFAHRRKTLVNSLRDEGYDPAIVTHGLTTLGIPAAIRAENVGLKELIELSKQVRAASQ
ncbi:16S rRNA (adenine(1518)-N(6)/adenine(1519)-N(6))-dimethyltransferase RsmA [Petrachloros mirabilis]